MGLKIQHFNFSVWLKFIYYKQTGDNRKIVWCRFKKTRNCTLVWYKSVYSACPCCVILMYIFFIRVEHARMHAKHKGHEAMHAEMVLILIVTLVVAQLILVQWKQRHPKSYNVRHKAQNLGWDSTRTWNFTTWNPCFLTIPLINCVKFVVVFVFTLSDCLI